MLKYFRAIIYLFPLFLGGIFFITLTVWAQQATVNATVQISVCGNFIAEGGEDCDNVDFDNKSCSNYGFNAGDLSCVLDCTIDTSSCYTEETNNSSGGGGGGGGAPVVQVANTVVNFSGKAYPLSKVTILKDGQIAISTIAGPNASFDASLAGLSTGNYNFAVYSEDDDENRSALFSFSVYASAGSSTDISGIFLSPTISVDKKQVRQGDDIAIFGQSIPDSTVTISVNSEEEYFRNINTDNNGAYLYYFDTSVLEKGNHHASSKTRLIEEVSPYGQAVSFKVGNNNLEKDPSKGCGKGGSDLNCDTRINIVDFSIAAYWHGRANPPGHADLNKDGKVDIVDFSIMAFNWTG